MARSTSTAPPRPRLATLAAADMADLPDAQLPAVIEPCKVVRFHVDGADGDAAGWLKLFEGDRAGYFGCPGVLRVQVWVSPGWCGFTRLNGIAIAQQVSQAVAAKNRMTARHRVTANKQATAEQIGVAVAAALGRSH